MRSKENYSVRRMALFISRGILLFAMWGLSACTTSPATGKKVISFNDPFEEKRIGQREHPKIIKQFGGVYNNSKVKNYVNHLGNNLAKVSELSKIGWTFTVLNSSEINAFAIPGGFIYITRGLITLANSEAELAGVIAHEIGHVTALHSSTRQATGRLAGLGAVAAGILFGQAGSQLGNLIGRASVQNYSQRQEFEADALGVRYLSRAGYDTKAMASFLTKMRAVSKLNNRKLGRPESTVDQYSIFASHPRTLERVQHAIQEASGQASGHRQGRIDYMEMLHGIVYGDELEQGIIRGRDFIHPVLKFRFTVPKGFRLINGPNAVLAMTPDGAVIQFDTDFRPYHGTMASYLRNVWAPKANLTNIERVTVNGMVGAMGARETRRREGVFNLRLVAVRHDNRRIFRMLFLTPLRKIRQLSAGIRAAIFSLRIINDREASAVKPYRIFVKAVSGGHTVNSFVRQMALVNFKEETFRVLNGLGSTDHLRIGQLVKIVTN